MVKLPRWSIPVVVLVPYVLALGLATWQIYTGAQADREGAIRVLASNTRRELQTLIDDRHRTLALWHDVFAAYLKRLHADRGSFEARQIDYLAGLDPAEVLPTADLVLLVDCRGEVLNVRGASAAGKLRGQMYSAFAPGHPMASTWIEPVFKGKGRYAALAWHKSPWLRPAGDATTVEELAEAYAFALASGIPVANEHCPGTSTGYAVVLAVGWAPFQDRLTLVTQQLDMLKFNTGYAYLIDHTQEAVIGHRTAGLYGQTLDALRSRPENRGLGAFVEHIRATAEGAVEYQFPGTTDKRAYTARLPVDDATGHVRELAWTVGVGIDDSELRDRILRGFLLALVVGLAAYLPAFAIYYWTKRRYRMTFGDITAHIRNARSSEDLRVVDAGEGERDELYKEVTALLLRERAQAAFTPIKNPYIVGNPVQTEQMFFGRKVELQWIREQIERAGNEMILLVGQRRVGKTSLLYRTKEMATQAGVGAVFINAQRLTLDLRSDNDFFSKVGNAICDQLPDHPGVSRFRGSGYPMREASDLSALIHMTAANGRGLIVLFDELETLSGNMRNGFLSDAPLLWLAGQLEDRPAFSVVATGSSEFPREAPAWNTLAGKVQTKRVSFLERDDAERLVREPLQPTVMFQQGLVESIVRFTGSHPLYTQDFCHRLVGHLNHERHSHVEPRDFEVVADDMVRNPPNSIEEAWRGLGDQCELLLSALAVALADAGAFVSLDEALECIPADLQGQHLALRTDLQRAVAQLLAGDWLDHSGGRYRFACDLWRLWVRVYHPL